MLVAEDGSDVSSSFGDLYFLVDALELPLVPWTRLSIFAASLAAILEAWWKILGTRVSGSERGGGGSLFLSARRLDAVKDLKACCRCAPPKKDDGALLWRSHRVVESILSESVGTG